jgi:hypothetical protein
MVRIKGTVACNNQPVFSWLIVNPGAPRYGLCVIQRTGEFDS